MRVGIDASNTRMGGGLNHIVQILAVGAPAGAGIAEVIVWGGRASLQKFEDRPWLRKVHDPILDRSGVYRLWWQQRVLPSRVRAAECSLLWAPGGTLPPALPCPAVTMFRNLLPFERREAARFGFSIRRARYWMLHHAQARSFLRADGVIFLQEHARRLVETSLGKPLRRTVVIPHGVAEQFRRPPRQQRPLSTYSAAEPFRVLYVSVVNVYKHQWHVAEAIGHLRRTGLPVTIDFVGPAYPPALRRLRRTMSRWDPGGAYLRYRGPMRFDELPDIYHKADLFVFASSCENMPNILLEAMASGLPIACARCEPMVSMLGERAVYFNPEDPAHIADALSTLLLNPALRVEVALDAYTRSQAYSWPRCAAETFDWLAQIARDAPRVPAQ